MEHFMDLSCISSSVSEEDPHKINAAQYPNDDVAYINPAIILLIDWLFPRDGIKFLAFICRLAKAQQFGIQDKHMAIVMYHGTKELSSMPDCPLKYHAIFRYLVVFEALGIFQRYREHGMSIVRMALGDNEPLPTQQEMLQAIENLLHKDGYKDKKLQQLLKNVKARILLYDVSKEGDSRHTPMVQKKSLFFYEVEKKWAKKLQETERLSGAKSRRIAHMMCNDQLPQMFQVYLQMFPMQGTENPDTQKGDISLPKGILSTQSGDFYNPFTSQSEKIEIHNACNNNISALESPQLKDMGDFQQERSQSPHNIKSPLVSEEGDFQNKKMLHTTVINQHISHLNRPDDSNNHIINPGFTHEITSESPLIANNLGNKSKEGDLELHSNLDIIYFNKIIRIRNLKFETEELLQKEAEKYVDLIDGNIASPKIRKSVITGYKNKIREQPGLACICLINTLLRKYCPLPGVDKALRSPRQWFYSSFKRYLNSDEALNIDDDIKSWAEAATYSYEEIAQTLQSWFAERHTNPWMRRPWVEDAIVAGLLEDRSIEQVAPSIYASECNEEPETIDDVEVEPYSDFHYDNTYLPNREQTESEYVEMEDGSLLSVEEYAYLQERADRTMLFESLVDPSDEAEGVLLAYVEQFQGQLDFSEPEVIEIDLPICQYARKLQTFLAKRQGNYTVEVKRTPGCHWVIEVCEYNEQHELWDLWLLRNGTHVRQFVQAVKDRRTMVKKFKNEQECSYE
jgi:hypothetical protein